MTECCGFHFENEEELARHHGKPVPFKWEGTVSHATLRHEDLIPAFERVLKDLNCCEAAVLRAEFDKQPGDYEDYADYVELLAHALEDAAPEGYYFGAHEGDGSDFGFWREEEDDD